MSTQWSISVQMPQFYFQTLIVLLFKCSGAYTDLLGFIQTLIFPCQNYKMCFYIQATCTTVVSLQCQTHSSWWSSCWQHLMPYWSFWGSQLHSVPACSLLWVAENTHSSKVSACYFGESNICSSKKFFNLKSLAFCHKKILSSTGKILASTYHSEVSVAQLHNVKATQ